MAGYDELRAQQCAPGEKAEIREGPIAGYFVCEATQSIDDGGVYFDVAGDVDGWIRLFGGLSGLPDRPTAQHPVRGDWFVTGDRCSTSPPFVIDNSGTCEITQLFKALATRYRSNRNIDLDGRLDLFWQMPNNISSVALEFINLSSYPNNGETAYGPVDSVYVLEPSTPINVTYLKTGTGDKSNVAMIQFGDVGDVVIGSAVAKASREDFNLTFVGCHNPSDPDCDVTSGNNGDQRWGLIAFMFDEAGDRTNDIRFRANVHHSRVNGLRVATNPLYEHDASAVGEVDSFFVAGTFHDPGSYITRKSAVTIAEDVYTSDRWGVSMAYCAGRTP